jgi:pSer/pThr/pTyr-binding forkhead associated (FHA) protein
MIRGRTAAEIQAILQMQRAGIPFLMYRDVHDALQLLSLPAERERVRIGRLKPCDVVLGWDTSVSRVHAELEWFPPAWTLIDDGISTNGTYLNDVRLTGRRRLRSGDLFRIGSTLFAYHDPGESDFGETERERPIVPKPLTPRQHAVLVELCRPVLRDRGYGAPATNAQIADALVLSIDGVKTHMRALFDLFAVGDLPQNQKRAKLVELALRGGIVTDRDVDDD